MTGQPTAPASASLEGLEELARNTMGRIDRRRYELIGLTMFVLVAFAVGVVTLSIPDAPLVSDFDPTARVLRLSLLPLALGFAVYLFDKERQLRRLTHDAHAWEQQAAQRLKLVYEMKDALLTAVSHEVRTPLTKAIGYAQMIQLRGGDLAPEALGEFAGKICESLRTLESLLSDLLDVDRLWRDAVDLRSEPVDLGVLAARVAATVAMGERTVEVDGGVTAEVDPAKAERIVGALLVNARRHTPEGTRVWVRVLEDADGAVLCVEDDGPGVPKAEQEGIFRPFRHGSAAREHSPGTGIGLTVVERLAQLHGGRAWVEDRPGGGASFRVRFPRSGGGPASDGPEVHPSPTGGSTGPRSGS